MFLYCFSCVTCKLWIRSARRRTQQSSFRFQLNCSPILSIQNSRQLRDSQGLPKTLMTVMTLLYNESVEWVRTFLFPFLIELLSHFVHSKQPAAQRPPRPIGNIEESHDNIIVQWMCWMAKHFLFRFPIELLSHHFVHPKQSAAPRPPRPRRNIEESNNLSLLYKECIEFCASKTAGIPKTTKASQKHWRKWQNCCQ